MDASGANVVVGEDKAIGRDEAGRGSHANAGEAKVGEEGLSHGELVLGLHLGCGEGVV